MSTPDFDELDVLMGANSKGVRGGRENHPIIEGSSTDKPHRQRSDNAAAPEGESHRAVNTRKVIAGFVLVAMIVLGLLVWWVWRSMNAHEPVDTGQLVAETLGPVVDAPGVAAVDPAPTSGAAVEREGAETDSQSLVPPISTPTPAIEPLPDAAAAVATAEMAESIETENLRTEHDRLVAESTKWKSDLEQARAELAQEKARAAKLQRDLEAQRRRQTDVLVRDAKTTVTLTEVLSDGVVLRDRRGNEIVVPRGSSFDVLGDRVVLGGSP